MYQWPSSIMLPVIHNEIDDFKHMLTCSCIFCVKGLQCVLSTVGIPASVLLQAVRTVSETAQKQSKYIMYPDNLPRVYCILFVSYVLVPAAIPISQTFRFIIVFITKFSFVIGSPRALLSTGVRLRGCPTGGIQFELSVIRYSRNSRLQNQN